MSKASPFKSPINIPTNLLSKQQSTGKDMSKSPILAEVSDHKRKLRESVHNNNAQPTETSFNPLGRMKDMEEENDVPLVEEF